MKQMTLATAGFDGWLQWRKRLRYHLILLSLPSLFAGLI